MPDRPAARLRFNGHDAEILLTRQQDSLGAPIQVPYYFVGLKAQKLHIAAVSVRLQAGPVRPLSDDFQRHSGQPGGVDGELDPLVRHQRRYHQRVAFGCAPVRAVEVGVHGRVHDVRSTIIVSANSACNIM